MALKDTEVKYKEKAEKKKVGLGGSRTFDVFR
jgi:hypothetical protein